MSNPLLTQPQLRALRSMATRTLERAGAHWTDGRQIFTHFTIIKLNQRGFVKFARDRKKVRITPAGSDALGQAK